MKQLIKSFLSRLPRLTPQKLSSHSEQRNSELALVIADISGYTEYIKLNAGSTEHAHAVIADLLESIVHAMATPLVLNKFEGDAVFMYAPLSAENAGAMRNILDKSNALFKSFESRKSELANNRQACPCEACTGIKNLQIKIVIHSGTAAIRKIFQFEEISGPDVIRIHRLLKNNIESNQYLMVTEQAVNGLNSNLALPGVWSTETHTHLGDINVWIHDKQSTTI
jgi:hypothetical protein